MQNKSEGWHIILIFVVSILAVGFVEGIMQDPVTKQEVNHEQTGN